MALTGALFSGVSGINANGNAMNIIGDNIANANTIGFKSSRAVFFDLLSADVGGTKIGLGSRLAASSRLFVQGGVETTNSSTDLAIQGNGMFILEDAQGGTFYSRAGQFNIDANGNLANPAGLAVQGIALDAASNPISGVTDIVLSQLVAAPVPSTSIDLALNLDSTETAPAAALPADAAGTSALPGAWFVGANFSTVLTVIDSLGQAHDLTFLFRKAATANEWDYRVVSSRALTTVAEVMTHDIMSMLPSQNFADVVGMMATHSFRHLLVVDAEKRLCGVISDRDVLRALSRTPDWSSKSVSEIMTAEPLTAGPDMPISAAIKSMLAMRINCLPVVGADGRVCGILTFTDLLRTYEKVQTWLESVAQPTFDQMDR